MKVTIVIPAHNEEKRIEETLSNYCSFFYEVKEEKAIDTTFTIVLNGCTDRTHDIVLDLQKKFHSIQVINLKQPGKGHAVIEGFKSALKHPNDLIGFVDADMATRPQYFLDLIENIAQKDGIIASRYMKDAKVIPPRPFIKGWGRKLIFNPLIRRLFGINFIDFQCGAKLFKPHVLKKIVPHIQDTQWTFDVELLYLCKKYGFSVKEIPTVWYDQDDSKFKLLGSGIGMIKSLLKLSKYHKKQEKK